MQRPIISILKLAGACWATAGVIGCNCDQRPASATGNDVQLTGTAIDQPGSDELSTAVAMPVVDAIVDPPIGWEIDKRQVDAKHVHMVWKSPSGDTAYGVVLMYLPLPVGPDLVLAGFLNQLKQSDREAKLLSKTPAEELHGYRFVAESGQYVIRVDLSVRGWRAWAVYAGSLRGRDVNQAELDLAERARDRTRVNLQGESAFAE
jgi:hypothetical protein